MEEHGIDAREVNLLSDNKTIVPEGFAGSHKALIVPDGMTGRLDILAASMNIDINHEYFERTFKEARSYFIDGHVAGIMIDGNRNYNEDGTKYQLIEGAATNEAYRELCDSLSANGINYEIEKDNRVTILFDKNTEKILSNGRNGVKSDAEIIFDLLNGGKEEIKSGVGQFNVSVDNTRVISRVRAHSLK